MKRFPLRFVAFAAPCVASMFVGPALVAKSDVWNASFLESDSDWTYVYPNDVNESGRISGFWSDASGLHAIVWADPDASPVGLAGLAGESNSWAADINGSGTICGTSGSGWPVSRAVTWDKKGNVTDLNPSGWDHSDMWALNEAGESVGSAWNSGGFPFWACHWSKKGEVTFLDEGSGYVATWAISINKSGMIVGQAYPEAAGPPYARACYWDGTDGELVDVHDAVEDAVGEQLWVTLGYEATDDGEVVGWCHTADDFQLLAFVVSPSGEVTILDDGGTDNAFAWQSAGKYLCGAIGGDPGFGGTTSAAVWERGTTKGATTWTLHEIAGIDGHEMIAVGVNKEGGLVGAAQDGDGNVRAWYAKRSGR